MLDCILTMKHAYLGSTLQHVLQYMQYIMYS